MTSELSLTFRLTGKMSEKMPRIGRGKTILLKYQGTAKIPMIPDIAPDAPRA